MILVRRLRLIAEEFPLVELLLGLFGIEDPSERPDRLRNDRAPQRLISALPPVAHPSGRQIPSIRSRVVDGRWPDHGRGHRRCWEWSSSNSCLRASFPAMLAIVMV